MNLPISLATLLDQQLERLRSAAPAALAICESNPERFTRLQRLLIASHYATDRLCTHPELINTLEARDDVLELTAENESQWSGLIRRYRHAESVRLVYRDVNGIDTLDDTLHGASTLAERCISAALDAAKLGMEAKHGVPRNSEGMPQELIVYGLGKLGGGELNFSSDIDLVFAFPEQGDSDGARSLDNGTYFQRLGQRLIQLLADVDAEGMAFRVDMRLRPFGQVGRLALSFPAMEQYFQREGRDWERYAWIKARPVAGDLVQGELFLDTLRPFIYRRYLDFGAFEGLREMKAMIEAEVQRRELETHLKLGRGGIREIEFMVQLQQLIRAGREPVLRHRSLMPALARLKDAGYIPAKNAEVLLAAYRFLRQLENRVQMLREEQTHSIPEDETDRLRLAFGMGFESWEALAEVLAQHRNAVSNEFSRVFEAREVVASDSKQVILSALADIWREPSDEGVEARLKQVGFNNAEELARQLQNFHRLPAMMSLSAKTRGRLDRVMPALLAAAAGSRAADAAASRGLELAQTILRRSSYLALLDEQPAALSRLVEVMAGSRWMAERLCAHPLLLDDLLDVRVDATAPTREEVGKAVEDILSNVAADDVEARIYALNEFRQSFAFRVARARLIDRQSASECTRQLAFVAEAVINAVIPMAIEDLARQHGLMESGGLAAIAYGSFGGKELSFGSDLDLVFLYQASPADTETNGARPLDAVRYYTRVVQKIIAMLSTSTPAGRLYEADLRLRPDGGKGLLVSSVESFSIYQHERAWTWEQLALVRARAVSGDTSVCVSFQRERDDVLSQSREVAIVREETITMRAKMREALDRSTSENFDIKQGEGGLVDLEFLLQAGVLIHAQKHPELLKTTRTLELIDNLLACGYFTQAQAEKLHQAHEYLSGCALDCTLDNRPRVTGRDTHLAQASAAVIEVWKACLMSSFQ